MKATKMRTVGTQDCYSLAPSASGERLTFLVPKGTPVRYVRTTTSS